MPETQIHNWLIINWQDESTRTRKSEPTPSSLGTHEIATEIHLDVVIPDVEVDELYARVEVPQPRVEATELEDVDAEDVPGWQDVADDYLEKFADTYTMSWDMWRTERDGYIVRILSNAPGRPDVEEVQQYCDEKIRDRVQTLEA